MKRKIVLGIICGVVLFCFGNDVVAGTFEEIVTGYRTIWAPLLGEKPVIDGRIDDTCYQSAEKQGTFILNTPVFSLPLKQTNLFIGRDYENLYVAFECLEPDITKIKRVKARMVDDIGTYLFNNDCVEIFLMPEPDGRFWYHLALDAAGQLYAMKEEPKSEDKKATTADFFSVQPFANRIRYAVQISQGAWTAEIAIPFKDIGVDPSFLAKQTWRVNFCREEKERGELSTWNRVVNGFQNPDRFGNLVFTESEEYQKQKSGYLTAVEEYLKSKELSLAREIAARKERVYEFKYAFSFGPEDAPLKKGYKRVSTNTVYTPQSGYGWVGNLSGLTAGYQKCNGKLGSYFVLYTEELFSEFITGDSSDNPDFIEHTFKVDLPNGDYKIHMVMGQGVEEGKKHRRLFNIFLNDQLLFPVEVGNLVFAQPFFRVKVTTGSLKFRFQAPKKISLPLSPELREMVPDEMAVYQPGWIINAIVIYPAKDRKIAEEQIAKDERDFNLLPAEKLVSLPEKVPPADPPLTDIKNEERSRGYLVFCRNISEPLYKNSVPKRSEIIDSLKVRVTPGETTSASLGIYPLKDLDQLTVTVSDLLGPAAKKIPADRIEVGMVRFVPRSDMSGTYTMVPLIVEPIRYVDTDLNAGETRQIWFTIRVPEETSSGTYTSNITLNVAGGNPYIVKLNLEVLPFRLSESSKRFGYYLPEGYGSEWIHTDQHLLSMRDHGMNTVEFNYRNAEDAEAKLRLAKRFGFTGPIPLSHIEFSEGNRQFSEGDRPPLLTDEEKNTLREKLTKLRDYVKENNLPEPLFYAWDELLSNWIIQIAIDTYRTVKEIEGVRTYETCTPATLQPVSQYVDIPCMVEVPDFRKYRVTEEDRKKGKELWTYGFVFLEQNSTNFNRARFLYGWFVWSVGIDGVLPWAYMTYNGNPYNWLLGSSYYMVCVPGSIGGYVPLPTLTFELTRMGINDYRYIQTLSDLIAEAKSSTDSKIVALAQEEEAKLKKITDSVQGGISYYESHGYWKGEIYDKLRDKVIESILRLLKHLRRI
jgi:hypothetical protein